MLRLIDLMELYRIKTGADKNEDLFLHIFEESAIDERIDKEILADLIIAECGSMFPRWNTTTVFERFAISFFKTKNREYTKLLDLMEAEYNPLDSFTETETETVEDANGRTIEESGERSETTENTHGEETTETIHSVSAENESEFSPRSKDNTVALETTDTGTADATTINTTNDDYIGTKETERNKHGRNKTAQSLFWEEVNAATFNVYEKIVNDFSNALMIGIY